jgi:hypothetical protein
MRREGGEEGEEREEDVEKNYYGIEHLIW